MNTYRIGRVACVAADRLIVSLDDFESDGTTESGVPDNMTVNVQGDTGPQPVLIGQPGTFVSVSIPSGQMLAMIVSIDMRETTVSLSEIRSAVSQGESVVDKLRREIAVVPVGTLDLSDSFERGADVLPTVNASVHAVVGGTIDKIYRQYAEGNFSLGRLSLIPEQEANINLDAFLSRHAAILGQTGGGKSWTVASLLQKIAQFPQSTVVLFDLHGEYTNVFGEHAEVVSGDSFELPYWLMNSEELLGLMVDRTESAAPNQIAKFKDLLREAKRSHSENRELGIESMSIDTPVFFEFDRILDEFRRLDTEMVEGARGPKKGPLHGQFTRLLMRVDSRLNDQRYNLIFHPQTMNTSASMEQLFRQILGEVENAQKKIVVVDLSPIPFDVRNSVISLMLRCLFDFSYWYRRQHRRTYPISIFADEAHIYLNDRDSDAKAARSSAERIAKEGRKYGLSLTVISQRPREVSSTILSQCNSFLCLRLSNPDDQNYVRSLLPDSIRDITNMFSILRRGEAILLGDSVMMPTRIKIDRPDPTPDSDDTSFTESWNQEHTAIEMASVIDIWRRQGTPPAETRQQEDPAEGLETDVDDPFST